MAVWCACGQYDISCPAPEGHKVEECFFQDGDTMELVLHDGHKTLTPEQYAEAAADLREYLTANMFDGSEAGVLTESIDLLLNRIVENVLAWGDFAANPKQHREMVNEGVSGNTHKSETEA